MWLERWLNVVPLRFRSLFRATAVDRELDEELRFHIERQVALNVERGMTAEDARRAALRAMGGVEQHKELCRDRRRVQFADTVIRDARYGLRLLRRSPIFTVVAIVSLALGIGANAAIFQLIDTVRWRNLPIANPQELAEVRAEGVSGFGISEGANAQVTYPLWEQIRAHQTAFASMFAWGNATFLIGRGGEARRAPGLWVSGDFFRVLGITPERGRLLTADDDRRGCGAGPAVVSHAFWQTYLGGRESAIGSALSILDRPFTVVGVTRAGFTGLEIGQTFDIALPACSAALWGNSREGSSLDQQDLWWLTVMGRLKPDWTIARASEHLRTLSPGVLDATVPPGYSADLTARYRAFRFGVIPAGRGVSRLREAATPLFLLLGLTGLVLLITCGNLATLLLARASAREREVAVRVAMGASRPRLMSQMLIESLLVAVGGAALAIPVALLSGRALIGFFDTPANPVMLNLTADWRLVSFVGAIAVLTSTLFGLVPALRVSLVDPIAVIRQTSRGLTVDRHRARFQRGLVVGQIALSLVLVVSALLFVQSFRNLTAVDTGFEQNGTVAVSFLDLPSARALPLEQRVAFQQRLTGEIRSVPGVAAAAAATMIPLSGGSWAHFFKVPSLAGNEGRVSRFTYVSPGYFGTLKIPILSGRDFEELDNASSRRVMLVNESFVVSHLGGLQPIGATLRTVAEEGYPETAYEIIGVVGDTKYSDLREEPCLCDVPTRWMPPIAYVPIAQNPDLQPWASVIVRSGGALTGITSAITQRVARLNPAIAIQFTELKSQIRERLVAERMMAWLAGAFGVLAIALVTVGLYGIMAYLAVGRRNEIGVRLSLGSTGAQIVMLVLRDNLWLLAAGLAIGLPLAAATTWGASTLLFGLAPTDGPTLAGATSLLASAAALAGGIPAWRAAKIRPDVALRCD